MLTMTYAEEGAWDVRHISGCIQNIRQWLKRRAIAFRYVWVQELTKASRPHYHIVVWLPWGRPLPRLDQAGWWPHGSTRMEWARCAVGYVSKYVSKGQEGAKLPKGARMYGVGGLKDEALQEARWWALPGWLRKRTEEALAEPNPAPWQGHQFCRCPGGGWVDRESGECFTSPWRVVFEHGALWLYAVAEPPPRPCGGGGWQRHIARGRVDMTLLWSLAEVAHQLGNVSVRTVRRLIDAGKLPVCRVGGRRLCVPSAAVQDYVKNTTVGYNAPCVESGALKEHSSWPTDEMIPRSIGGVSPMQAAKELGALLAQPTAARQKRLKRSGNLKRIK
ncbi:MAG: excisionase family DNA-binding protein [Zoogloeaceae bacterium]|nr:excisionase family DNA-binding protein [Zoogloeaceae bacterium]